MAGATDAVRVKGLADLNKAFKLVEKELQPRLREQLLHLGEPVKLGAEGFATSSIRRNTERWSMMRVGFARNVVYVAPKPRGTRVPQRKRPKFGGLLMEKAMLPALERERENTVRAIDGMLERLGEDWERV